MCQESRESEREGTKIMIYFQYKFQLLRFTIVFDTVLKRGYGKGERKSVQFFTIVCIKFFHNIEKDSLIFLCGAFSGLNE